MIKTVLSAHHINVSFIFIERFVHCAYFESELASYPKLIKYFVIFQKPLKIKYVNVL